MWAVCVAPAAAVGEESDEVSGDEVCWCQDDGAAVDPDGVGGGAVDDGGRVLQSRRAAWEEACPTGSLQSICSRSRCAARVCSKICASRN